MSQITSYPPIVVPTTPSQKALPKKDGQRKGQQHQSDEKPSDEQEKKDGEGLDLKA